MTNDLMRIGQGFDIHRLVPDRPLKIGGVLIESPYGTLAHSDGDVLLHALMDALLGACGLGDIGEQFPPSDPQYKDADSRQLLQTVLQLIHKEGRYPVNMDSTVFLEYPKLTPYKRAIRDTLASLLAMDASTLSVKAKTMESLGPIGHHQAIAASVVVLVR